LQQFQCRMSTRSSLFRPSLTGEVLARLGTTPGGILPGRFTTPHGIAVDSQSNIYVGELSGAHGRASRKTRCRRSAASSTACARSLRSSKDLASKPHPGPSPQAPGIGSCRVGQIGGLGECPSAVLGGCLRLKKNTHRLLVTCALVNLFMA